jgi:hypothetical protein
MREDKGHRSKERWLFSYRRQIGRLNWGGVR